MKNASKVILVLTLLCSCIGVFAQEEEKPVIPEKVMDVFKQMIGSWDVKIESGDTISKGWCTYKWASGKCCVINNSY